MQAYADARHASLPETERVAYSVIALPVYNDMTEEECRWIVEAIRSAAEHAGELRRRLRQGRKSA